MKAKRKIKTYGWVRDIPDARDFLAVSPTETAATALPASADLRAGFGPCYDQGNLGSCTANATGAVFQYTETEQKGSLSDAPSRLFEYYNTRFIQGDTDNDSGGSIRDAIKALHQFGVCKESDWPYKVKSFATKPKPACYKAAASKKIKSYQKIAHREQDIKAQLAAGNPVAFGFSVYESFESDELASSGVMAMPDLANEQIIGGHAVCLAGYDDAKKMVLVRNSWGTDWAEKGYFWMPYEFAFSKNYCSDFWTITAVPADEPAPTAAVETEV